MASKELIQSCQDGNLSRVEQLIRGGANPAAGGNRALIQAIWHNRVEIARILLRDPRVNPAAPRNRPIIAATYTGNPDIMRHLLQDGRAAIPTSAITNAAEHGYAQIVRMLLDDRRVSAKWINVKQLRWAARVGGAEVEMVVQVWLTSAAALRATRQDQCQN